MSFCCLRWYGPCFVLKWIWKTLEAVQNELADRKGNLKNKPLSGILNQYKEKHGTSVVYITKNWGLYMDLAYNF